MWTLTTRRQHTRDHLRCGSDLTDAEGRIIAPFMTPRARTGRPRGPPVSETFYEMVEALQAELGTWLGPYNSERPYLGCGNKGRRPIETIDSFVGQEA